MTLLTCSAVRRRLPAFHDRELPVPELIEIEAHVADCAPCLHELRALQGVAAAMRLVSAPAPPEDWTGLEPGVISRMRAEEHESWTAWTRRLFDDMHLIWIGVAAAVATFFCGAVALSALHFASPDRADSLASVIQVISVQVPSVPGEGPIEAMLAQPVSRDELVLALSAVVTREGRVERLSVLNSVRPASEISPILEVLSQGRLEPGRMGNSPVAVNLVWLVAHTTVRPKAPRTT
jgi:hypothetical protein